MRYSLAVAGLVAAASATVTLTATEEVTITSCAPTHTACPYKKPHNDWESWDPKDPEDDSSASTWSEWDPKKPVSSTAGNNWGTWDPKDPKSTATATWSAWDPKDPESTGTWSAWDPKDPKSTAASTWSAWDPKDPESTATWSAWTSSKTPSDDSATATWSAWNGNETPDAAECPKYTATAPPAWFSQLPTSVLSSLAAKWTGAPPADWCYYSYSNGVVTQTKTPAADTAAATWSAWSGDATASGVKGVSATGTGQIAKYTGAATANAASFVMAGAAAVAAVVLA